MQQLTVVVVEPSPPSQQPKPKTKPPSVATTDGKRKITGLSGLTDMAEIERLFPQLLPTQKIEALHILKVYGEAIALNYIRAVLKPTGERVPQSKTTIITRKK